MNEDQTNFYFEHAGSCLVCSQATTFRAETPYFRNSLVCVNCRSAPRQRALLYAMRQHGIDWRNSKIHECSPNRQRIAQLFSSECKSYIATHYDTDKIAGTIVSAPDLPCKQYQVENLEHQTFDDESFDLVITQDVFEHVFDPGLAMAEIARTLRVGGATVMTVPIVMKTAPSRRRAALDDGKRIDLLPPEFHGNPIDGTGAIVTIDWGYDILNYFQQASGLSFRLIDIDNIDYGIRGDLNEVLIGFKLPPPAL